MPIDLELKPMIIYFPIYAAGPNTRSAVEKHFTVFWVICFSIPGYFSIMKH